jgi:hypothetical protein
MAEYIRPAIGGLSPVHFVNSFVEDSSLVEEDFQNLCNETGRYANSGIFPRLSSVETIYTQVVAEQKVVFLMVPKKRSKGRTFLTDGPPLATSNVFSIMLRRPHTPHLHPGLDRSRNL